MKALDCVEMKREIQAKILAETRGMSDLEKIEYYRRRAIEAGDLWRRVQDAPRSRRKIGR